MESTSPILSDKQFVTTTLPQGANTTEGGATRSVQTGRSIGPGSDAWAVGGMKSDSGEAIPEHRIPVADFNEAHAKAHQQHLLSLTSNNPNAHQGSWVHKGEVYLDGSEVMHNKVAAWRAGYSRGEKAIFGFKNMEEFPIRKPKN